MSHRHLVTFLTSPEKLRQCPSDLRAPELWHPCDPGAHCLQKARNQPAVCASTDQFLQRKATDQEEAQFPGVKVGRSLVPGFCHWKPTCCFLCLVSLLSEQPGTPLLWNLASSHASARPHRRGPLLMISCESVSTQPPTSCGN